MKEKGNREKWDRRRLFKQCYGTTNNKEVLLKKIVDHWLEFGYGWAHFMGACGERFKTTEIRNLKTGIRRDLKIAGILPDIPGERKAV